MVIVKVFYALYGKSKGRYTLCLNVKLSGVLHPRMLGQKACRKYGRCTIPLFCPRFSVRQLKEIHKWHS